MPGVSDQSGSAPTADENRVFDVTRPGKSGPHATSRPLIVGHRPLLDKDPMVRSADSASNSKSSEKPSGPPFFEPTTKHKISESEEAPVIKPLYGANKPPDLNEQPAKEPKEAVVAHESSSSESLPEGGTQPTANTVEGHEPGSAQAAIKKAEQEAAAREQELAKLAASKTYALPISQKTTTRMVFFGVVGLAAAMAAAIFIIMSKS